MPRAVLTLDLKDDPAVVASYRWHHARIWPEVAESLRQSGIREMEIFLLGRALVMIVESDGRDLAECFAAHHASANPRVVEWETLMKSMQVPPADARPGEWWASMDQVFQLSTALH